MEADYEYQEEGVVEDLIFLAVGVVVIGVVVMIGINIMVTTESNVDTGGLTTAQQTDANAAIDGTFELMNDTVSNYGIVIIAVLGALAIGAIMSYLVFFRGGRSGNAGAM